jgi:anti-sigma-K factor RskA
VVVFDPHKQEGVVNLNIVPQAGPGKDYQLWIFDPATGKPVSAGILRPSADGKRNFQTRKSLFLARIPLRSVSSQPGGSNQPSGPVILQGKFLLEK